MKLFSPDPVLHDVVGALASIERRAGSEGEAQAAEWIASRLEAAGARHSRVEHVDFWDGYALMLLPLAAVGLLSGIATVFARAGRTRRPLLAAIAAGAAGLIVDDVTNGRRPWRRTIQKPKRTTNVIAECGDSSASRTLIILAHHDAAPTGAIFDQRVHHAVAAHAPGLVARIDTSLPMWWPIAGGPAAVSMGAAIGSRRIAWLGTALSAVSIAAGADIARNRIVPGANDNLSAVAALVALAKRLDETRLRGLRVLLVSAGAEEVLQGGIYAFRDQYLNRLDPENTWVLNLDTIGSPELILVEGEGQFWMEDYHSPEFRDLIASVAERTVGPLRRGARSRGSTDAVITSRAGYPTALLSSWDEHKALSNYHLMSDTPDNLCFETIQRASELCFGVAQELARI